MEGRKEIKNKELRSRLENEVSFSEGKRDRKADQKKSNRGGIESQVRINMFR